MATKYINRYNEMFPLVFRSTQKLSMNLFFKLTQYQYTSVLALRKGRESAESDANLIRQTHSLIYPNTFLIKSDFDSGIIRNMHLLYHMYSIIYRTYKHRYKYNLITSIIYHQIHGFFFLSSIFALYV